MPETGTNACPVLRPTKKQFSRPFHDFIAEYFKANPTVPVIKVVPPADWTPRRSPYPKELKIEAPIEQRVLLHDNKPGYYDCVLLQQKPLTVEQFKEVAKERGPPKQGRGNGDDTLLERPFWSSVTSRPPLYGADTPLSLFDKKLDYGWNLQNLGCLLSKYKVPKIPGVTTPMTYFGMWKSFFSWHVEDVDLLSINYLHHGASKVWYAIAPGENRKRFEAFVRTLYPNDAKSCSNFLRHKNCLITPKLIRDEGIPLVTVRQDQGEFIILNAGAYHAGYNTGFNCAEAVNFATEEWIPLGQQATRCDCKAMGKDAVSVDMRIFPGCEESSSSDSDDSQDDDSEMEQVASDEGSSNAPKRPPSKKPQNKAAQKHGVSGKKSPGRPRKAAPASSSESGSQSSADNKLKVSKQAMKAKASKQAERKSGSPVGGKQMRGTKEGRRRQVPLPDTENQAGGKKRKSQAQDSNHDAEPASKKSKGNAQAPVQKPRRTVALQKKKPGRPRKQPLPNSDTHGTEQHAVAGTQNNSALARGPGRPSSAGTTSKANLNEEVVGQPFAVIGQRDSGERFFYLVQRLSRQVEAGRVAVRWLKEHTDGRWHESGKVWTEDEGALMRVRTQTLQSQGRNCYKLLTMRSKIIGVDLED